MKRVAIIYLAFHRPKCLDRAIAALEKLDYPRDLWELVIVDNPHPELGPLAGYIEQTVMPKSRVSLPNITLIKNETNVGFAGGNNVGIQYALENGFEYVYLHNDDSFLDPLAIKKLVEAMEADNTIGAAQALIMLYPETNLINSAGNAMHYLAMGYAWGYRRTVEEMRLERVQEVIYGSGAGIMLRADLLKKYGLWDQDFFMYHEDIEYSYRLKAAGYKIVLARDALAYHEFQFKRSVSKYFWIERNRYGVMLMFYKWPTLFLLFPVALLLELGMLVFSIRNGWFGERLRMYRYWLRWSSWKLWLSKRKKIQNLRTVSDRILMKNMVARVLFQEDQIKNPLLDHVGNPIMAGYWWVAKRVMFW